MWGLATQATDYDFKDTSPHREVINKNLYNNPLLRCCFPHSLLLSTCCLLFSLISLGSHVDVRDSTEKNPNSSSTFLVSYFVYIFPASLIWDASLFPVAKFYWLLFFSMYPLFGIFLFPCKAHFLSFSALQQPLNWFPRHSHTFPKAKPHWSSTRINCAKANSVRWTVRYGCVWGGGVDGEGRYGWRDPDTVVEGNKPYGGDSDPEMLEA